MRHFSDEEQYSEEVLDKSTEIWTGAAKKRQKAIQILTPHYSRQLHPHHTNQSSTIIDKQLENIKEKLNTQKSASKHKDFEIQNLKEKINQLNKDKHLLLNEIGVRQSQSQQHRQAINQNTINLEKTHQNQKLHQSRHLRSNKSQLEESIQEVCNEKLQDLPRQKLLQLLRSTSQYRSFIDYHDSHDLVFLKELHQSAKRTTKVEKRMNEEWSDAEIMNEMARLNQKQNLGLNYHNQTNILAKVKEYYDRQFDIKARNLRSEYEAKIKKTIKEVSVIPEDLRQICKIKEGQLARQMARKHVKSTKKKDHY